MKHLRPLTATATLLVAVSTLTACGSSPAPADAGGPPGTGASTSTTSPDAARHNDGDTTFAQMMVIHHEGAIEMAQLAAESATTAEVRELAERIAAAQGPEIELMTSWLEDWDEPAPEDAPMDAMDHGGMDMQGMDQQAVMSLLSGLSGTEFDRRFLELMIDHHRGAIEMAETVRAEGENPDALRLAGLIIDDQTAEITEMTNLVAGLR